MGIRAKRFPPEPPAKARPRDARGSIERRVDPTDGEMSRSFFFSWLRRSRTSPPKTCFSQSASLCQRVAPDKNGSAAATVRSQLGELSHVPKLQQHGPRRYTLAEFIEEYGGSLGLRDPQQLWNPLIARYASQFRATLLSRFSTHIFLVPSD